MLDKRVQLPPNIKPGTKEATQFHKDLVSSLQQKMLDYHVQNPGIAKGTGGYDGQYVRPVAPDLARQRYADSLVGQPHSTLAHLGFDGDEPITPEVAQAVAQTQPTPMAHRFEPDPGYNDLMTQYRMAQLAPVAAQAAYNAAGGPAVNAYLQTSKKPDLNAYEKFKSNAMDVTPILDAAEKLRQTEQGFGIQAGSQTGYRGALDSYLGPPPPAAPSMAPKGPVVPPPPPGVPA